MFSRLSTSSVLMLVCTQLLCFATHGGVNKGADRKQFEPLGAFVKTQAEEGRFSGVVLVGKSGKAVFSSAYGLANRETQAKINMETKFDLVMCPRSLFQTVCKFSVDFRF